MSNCSVVYQVLLVASLFVLDYAWAQKKYDSGATDTEITIGQTMAYSGPASAYGTYGKLEAAYFRMITNEGGINGRKVRFLSLDDGFSPPKTVEQTRRLVEHEQVLLIFGSLGTAPNSAVMKYLNQRKIPQLFLGSAASKFYDSRNYPWTMGILFNYQEEASIYARHLLTTNPQAKVAILYQNDDFGRDFVRGFAKALGSGAEKTIVAQVSYELTDPTIDSQVISLRGSGADAFLNITSTKFAVQSIRKLADLGWKPLHFLPFPSSSLANVLKVAGLDRSLGILSASSLKDPSDPQWQDAADMKTFLAFMQRYYPEGDTADQHNAIAYISSFLIVHVLRQCGDDLTRDNVLHHATTLHDLEAPLLLPGIKVNTGPLHYQQISNYRMRRFDGRQWRYFGDMIDAAAN
jgi:ABC-type branched-subunit amino acid transport system substrate-binding protein